MQTKANGFVLIGSAALHRDGLRLVLSETTQVGVSRSRRSHGESLLSPSLR
jgi:hypothetical protein